MRVFVALVLVIAAAKAASIANDYLPPIADNSLPVQESIQSENKGKSATLADDGYRYKVVRKLKQRLRRDVNELKSSEYLPPVAKATKEVASAEPSVAKEETPIVDETPEEKTLLAEDGYHYKTVRRLKYRQRRDVNELPNDKYLPSADEKQPESENSSIIASEPEVKTQLADDGYHYQTVRRLKYRHRRDVNELPANDYLPPAEEKQAVAEEVSVVVAEPEDKTDLAEDGYHYKTVRRLKYRQRRDVSELGTKEYLPPKKVEKPVSEKVSVVESVPEVKTNLPSKKVEQAVSEKVSVVESVPEVKTDLDENGYHYKTVRRLKYRQRRDVNELNTKEYLPPTEAKKPVSKEAPVVETVPEVKTDLAEDGYRYKTVRRLKYRQRRDVNELPTKEYLPPTKVEQAVSEKDSVVESVPEAKTDLAEDGYHYKTVRRLKYRQRRDVNELNTKEYLPPTEVKEPISKEASVVESVPEVKTDLAEDGYRYKTVRRLKYRQRRDVSELPAKTYLPPTEVKSEPPVESEKDESLPEVKTELADDGYHYKTVRRLKYRRH